MSYNSKYTGAEVEALLDAANGKQDKIEDLDAIRSGAAAGATALQSIPSEYVTESELNAKGYATTSALNDKVDKVTGKGLSTEDFTSALKSKLEGLSNYDDTELSEAISTLRGDFDKLVSGDTTTAIKTFNEVIAFLDGIQDTQDLSSIIASIEQQIASKMDKVTLATVATSGSYNDLSNKPTIPSAVTESTISGWGFTKNTGTYSKPSGGIPKSDLASAVQTSLGKADSAVQPNDISEFVTAEDLAAVATSGSYNDLADKPFIPDADNIRIWGFAKGVKVNGAVKTPSATDGIVDLGTIEGGSGGNFVEKEEIGDLVAAQVDALMDRVGQTYALPSSANGDEDDILVSESNLKTINGQSLVGSGDITISGGGGSSSGGGGSMEYIEIEPEIEPGGASLFLQEAEPNKTYIVTEGLFWLQIQSFVEPNGLEGEYRFHFKALNCAIALPDSVLWANGQMPDTIDGICELSIIGTRYQGEVVYKAILTAFI